MPTQVTVKNGRLPELTAAASSLGSRRLPGQLATSFFHTLRALDAANQAYNAARERIVADHARLDGDGRPVDAEGAPLPEGAPIVWLDGEHEAAAVAELAELNDAAAEIAAHPVSPDVIDRIDGGVEPLLLFTLGDLLFAPEMAAPAA